MDFTIKGVRGPKPTPGALRRDVYRPAIPAEYKRLVEAIAESRNWSVQHTLKQALIRLATIEEAEAAELVE